MRRAQMIKDAGGKANKNIVMVLSLWQPWATLVAIGAKQVETRSWQTKYRGPIAIQATMGFPRESHKAMANPLIRTTLEEAGYDLSEVSPLPHGQIIAVGKLTGTNITEIAVRSLTDSEKAFGDYSPGRYAWYLSDVVKLAQPITAKGMQGLWAFEMPQLCPTCQGSGILFDMMNELDRKCFTCKGRGRPLPSIAEVGGSDPDFTGGLSTQEYIDEIRGRNDKDE